MQLTQGYSAEWNLTGSRQTIQHKHSVEKMIKHLLEPMVFCYGNHNEAGKQCNRITLMYSMIKCQCAGLTDLQWIYF